MNRFLLLPWVLCLSACGFHLQGHTDLGSRLHHHHWTVEGGQMQVALENALRRQPGVVLDAPGADTVRLKVLSLQQYKDVSAINIGGNTTEYLLTLDMDVQAYRAGQAWGAPMRVVVQRHMQYADSEILGKQIEEGEIWREMRGEAAGQLVRRLAYLPRY